MIGAINTAMSGLDAASKRIEASASNIANSRNSIAREEARVDASPPPRERRDPPLRDPPLYEPVRVYQDSVEGGGTRAEFVPINPPHVIVYDPGDRVADDDGLVARPNVDFATEFSNMTQAEHAYKANLKTIATENAMIGALLNEVH